MKKVCDLWYIHYMNNNKIQKLFWWYSLYFARWVICSKWKFGKRFSSLCDLVASNFLKFFHTFNDPSEQAGISRNSRRSATVLCDRITLIIYLSWFTDEVCVITRATFGNKSNFEYNHPWSLKRWKKLVWGSKVKQGKSFYGNFRQFFL